MKKPIKNYFPSKWKISSLLIPKVLSMIYISIYLGSNKGQKREIEGKKEKKKVFWCFFKEAWEGEYNFLLLPSGLILYISISQNHSVKIWLIFISLTFYVKWSLVNWELQKPTISRFLVFCEFSFSKIR